MRSSLIAAMRDLPLQSISISRELPYDESGTPLYLKNSKTIYIDNLQVEQEPLISTLNGLTINNQVNIVRIYFTTDAKNQLANYDTIINQLRSLKDTVDFPGATRREALVSTSYEGDLTVTELEYRLTRLN